MAEGKKVAGKKVAAKKVVAAAKKAPAKRVKAKKIPPPPAGPRVTIVNIIPKSLSSEINQDSEPNIAVNPKNPKQIVATAFTPDPAGGAMAPLFVSSDGGATWTLNSIVPSDQITGDISIAFSPATNEFYAGILRFPAPPQETRLSILRTDNAFGSTAMTVVEDRLGVDQPFLIGGVSNVGGLDRVYVGDNDLASPAPKTSTVDVCLDARQAVARFKALRVDAVAGSGQNGPQVRPACHPDGTVYVGFYRWLSRVGDWQGNTLVVTADAVLVRDDHGATGAVTFADLQDTDGSPGRRLAAGVKFPFHSTGLGVPGQQRRGGDLAVAVDPADSAVVYVSWSAVETGHGHTLHLQRSANRGQTWTELLTIHEAINPSIAVNDSGKVAFLYQQLTGTAAHPRWDTHVQISQDAAFAHWSDTMLATVPADAPSVARPTGFDPYIGDYTGMVSVGRSFFGVFCANNTPDPANFPQGVTFQRSHDMTSRKLLDRLGREVKVSIDPFFFSVTP